MDSPFLISIFWFKSIFSYFLNISMNFLLSLFLLKLLIWWHSQKQPTLTLYAERKFEQCGKCNTLKKKKRTPSHILTQSKSIKCMCHPYNSDVYWPFDLCIVVSVSHTVFAMSLLYSLHFSILYVHPAHFFFNIAYIAVIIEWCRFNILT